MKITGKFYVRLDNKDGKLFTYNQVFKKMKWEGFPITLFTLFQKKTASWMLFR
jgi:hypothetical protein